MPTVGEEMPFGVRNMIDNCFRNKRRAEVISPIGHQNRNVNVFELIGYIEVANRPIFSKLIGAFSN